MSDIDIGFNEFLEKHQNDLPKDVDFEKIRDFCFLTYTIGYVDGKKDERMINNGRETDSSKK